MAEGSELTPKGIGLLQTAPIRFHRSPASRLLMIFRHATHTPSTTMSLFASAFESSGTAGPSAAISQSFGGKTKHKRKRPSQGGDAKDDQLRATQVNLARLMQSVENGDVGAKGAMKNKRRDSTGGEDQKGHIKGKTNDKGKAKAATQEDSRPVKKQKGGAKSQQHTTEGKQDKQRKAGEKSKGDDKPQTKRKAVEIPLPPSPVVKDKSDTKGMTNMQRDMKAKLEGARFRWINEQLYSIPSTEAVAMMKKDPKIFADVSSV